MCDLFSCKRKTSIPFLFPHSGGAPGLIPRSRMMTSDNDYRLSGAVMLTLFNDAQFLSAVQVSVKPQFAPSGGTHI